MSERERSERTMSGEAAMSKESMEIGVSALGALATDEKLDESDERSERSSAIQSRYWRRQIARSRAMSSLSISVRSERWGIGDAGSRARVSASADKRFFLRSRVEAD
jgi:hypothetical protein